jgi:hypothetical protein
MANCWPSVSRLAALSSASLKQAVAVELQGKMVQAPSSLWFQSSIWPFFNLRSNKVRHESGNTVMERRPSSSSLFNVL